MQLSDYFTAISRLCLFLRVHFSLFWRELIWQADWHNSCSNSLTVGALCRVSPSYTCATPCNCHRASNCLVAFFRGAGLATWLREFSCCSGNLGSNPTQTKFIFSLQRQPFCYCLCRHWSQRLWSLFRFDGAPKAFALIIKILKKIYEAVPTPRPLFRHFLHDVTESC